MLILGRGAFCTTFTLLYSDNVDLTDLTLYGKSAGVQEQALAGTVMITDLI